MSMDDDADIEGVITRSLFRTDSDSDEEDTDMGSTEEVCISKENTTNPSPETSSGSTVRREVMHVVLKEQETGGSEGQLRKDCGLQQNIWLILCWQWTLRLVKAMELIRLHVPFLPTERSRSWRS
jgi:hypothetical protein